ncbi:isoprenylcysteine carboxyl methyltransferase family protein [Elizabethkingia miricola]|uniref:isoprenylcysteine carboxyl methyltransferase family protein n=2 Tax=Elizabethkingia miricola TaxID=172045 RepID=UPI000C1497EF|nr:isoprenylcysteine carboxyl methyltransferase family protein [Elizabethkingia miricola]PSL86868.1 hypothetical protein C7V10_18540 [Elizabethkingia miricola]QHQ85832.1 hypothetical protein FE632_03060 [Elizabethkingia miricola]UIO97068.1 isoprenylcysteine carboxyl methyltransferase family protein [Elizabethkingia miricola]WER13853.1 isoprenylcysteine carboxyl methyltransferase family protein [Elizabethkingia miricola]WGL74030.1 isoprenylcysteine carboxyl methyltransferase family protein [Eli
MSKILFVFLFFFIFRIISLIFSILNEKRIKKNGAIEVGRTNSILLTIVHLLYYMSCLYEAYFNRVKFDSISIVGVFILFFAYSILFYVIYELKDVWTVKIFILPEHKVNRSFLFRMVRHPNYFLNIIPELIGLGFLCHSWKTMTIGLPIYLIVLFIRISQEEKAMKNLY